MPDSFRHLQQGRITKKYQWELCHFWLFWGDEDERRAKMSQATHHMSSMDSQKSDNGEFQ
jgi:hypothetical protein